MWLSAKFGEGRVYDVVGRVEGIFDPCFISNFGQFSLFSCSYIFSAGFGVVSSYFTFELEVNIIFRMIVVFIRHF